MAGQLFRYSLVAVQHFRPEGRLAANEVSVKGSIQSQAGLCLAAALLLGGLSGCGDPSSSGPQTSPLVEEAPERETPEVSSPAATGETDTSPVAEAAPEDAPRITPEDEQAAGTDDVAGEMPGRLAEESPVQPVLQNVETAFSFSSVDEIAQALAAEPYKAPPTAPKDAGALNYDQYRRIQGEDGSKLWHDGMSGFEVHLDPRGYLFTHEVKVNILENGEVRQKLYEPGQFDFLDLPLDGKTREALGYSGFRLLAPFASPGKFDEVISFRGASFFRALGAGSVYGASARGISIGTASSEGEEFPLLREFWLATPKVGDTAFRLYALLDGKSITGAYEFLIEPGPDTVVRVRASFHPRRDISNVGVVPLTSMYYFSPHDLAKQASDFRPAVHDSQGLSFQLANGEWVWRPLINPSQLQVSVLAQDVPHGFGLMQRLREFSDYSDIEAAYHRRPNVWVKPGQGWQKGELTLVEIPTANEYNDNIVVFWKPGGGWKKGQPQRLTYDLHWSLAPPSMPSVIPVHQTRAGRVPDGDRRLFVIDFDSTDAALLENAEASVSASSGTVSNTVIKHHPETGMTRLSFELAPGSAQTAELRALLVRGGRPLTETWIYRWRAQ